MSGFGVASAGGTTDAASSVCGWSIVVDGGAGAGAIASGRSARKGASAEAAPVMASVLGLASAALGLGFGTIGAAVRRRTGARDTDGVTSGGALATGCSTPGRCSNSTTGVAERSAAETCAGTTTARRSDASIRRSSQGKPKPGNPSPCAPKVSINSNVWSSSESSSAYVSRLCSELMRWLSARRSKPWDSSVLDRRWSGTAAGAPQEGARSCRPADLTGPPVMTLHNQLGDIREPHPVHWHIRTGQMGVDSHMSERLRRSGGSQHTEMYAPSTAGPSLPTRRSRTENARVVPHRSRQASVVRDLYATPL
jgi:hypothetical protein